MNNVKFNFAAVISVILLLLYSYIVFMGIVYWKDGNVIMGLGLTAILVLVVLVSIWFMCKARATRFQGIGMTGQVVFGGVILVALALSSMPFAHFVNLVSNQKQINEAFTQSHKYAVEINKSYADYVENRKQQTRDFLTTVEAGKGVNNPEEFNRIFGLPGGTNEQKIDRMIVSLNNALLPASLKEYNEDNEKELAAGAKMSVWNIAMPTYVNRMDKTVKESVNTYSNLSKKARGYKGDTEYAPFTYSAFEEKNGELKALLNEMSSPSIISILVALAIFAIMLLPYYLVEKDAATLVTKRPSRTAEGSGGGVIGGRQRRSRKNEFEQRN